MRLPIEDCLDEFDLAFSKSAVVLLEAPPGAGKTTRIPRHLLQLVQGSVLVLEPRRLAAKRSAQRVAEELGELLGQTCGYRVRQEGKESPSTRLLFITEGLFLRIFMGNSNLKNISCVVIDEFHERNIHTDVAIGICDLLIKSTRPDLKVVIMSATLNTQGLGQMFPDAIKVQSEGRSYAVDIDYLQTEKSLEIAVEDGVIKSLEHKNNLGHILVFLSGASEIRRCQQHLKNSTYLSKKGSFEILELRSETPQNDQDRVFSLNESKTRKIILSTNVAETSLTIPGVTAVIDAGQAKISGYSPWTGFDTLDQKKISQASAIQRAGRAGRTSPGCAIRLYSKHDFSSRPAHELPEIQRVDLSQTFLELAASSNISFDQFSWVTAPQQSSIDISVTLLKSLGAFDTNGQCTDLGKQMARLPIHPRLSRSLILAHNHNCLVEMALCVALLSEGSPAPRNQEAGDFGHSDLYSQALKMGYSGPFHRDYSASQVYKIRESALQFIKMLDPSFSKQNLMPDFLSVSKLQILDKCLCAGFWDRLAKAKTKINNKAREFVFAVGGGQGILSPSSVTQSADYILVLDARQTKTTGGQVQVRIDLASEILLSTLTQLDVLTEKKEITVWDSNSQRARSFARLQIGNMVLEERQISRPVAEEEVLVEQLRTMWPMPFGTDQLLTYEELIVRVELLNTIGLKIKVPFLPMHLSDKMTATQSDEFLIFLMHVSDGKRNFAEILTKDLVQWVMDLMSFEDCAQIAKFCPDKIIVGVGRKVKVTYSRSQSPRVSSRIQDFFGTTRTPTVLGGAKSVVVELLAPNGQSVQVTEDLCGFWKNGYPLARRELMRRYPRHFWPENPEEAEPPPPRPPRQPRK